MIRNQANQVAEAQMISVGTGAAFAGAVTVYVTIDNGVQALGSVGAGVCTLKGHGLYQYAPSQAETDGATIAFTFEGALAVPQTVQYATVTEAQQAALVAATGVGAVPVQTIVNDAMTELGIYQPGQAPSGDDAAFVLGKLNRLFDNWNAAGKAIYAAGFSTFALTPGLNPHTLGPDSATWTATQRPQTIDGMNLLLGSGTSLQRLPIWVRDREWWQTVILPNLPSEIPTDCYYEPSWPNGKLYFVPVPTTAYNVEIRTNLVLAQVALTDSFWMPPGYRDAVTLTLAESIAPTFLRGTPIPAQTKTDARNARALVFDANDMTPRISTIDTGMPGSRARSTYNYQTGPYK